MKNTKGLEEAVNNSTIDGMFETVATGIQMVFDHDTVYEDSTHQEKREFIENLNKNQFDKLMEFCRTIPTVSHDISFTCEKCGETETINIRGLASFFS